MDLSNLHKTKFDLLGLDGKYLQLIGEACKPTNIFIYGPGGSGKSTLTINLSYYLAKKGNTILYVAGEQFGTPVFSKALIRLGIKEHTNLKIVRNLEALNPSNFDIVVLDSKDSLGIEVEQFTALTKKHPHQSFIILSMATKDSGFTGSEKWRNLIDTMIYCEDMVAYTKGDKNRWGGKGQVKIVVENKG